MPITVNGIGTRYVGRRNSESETGVCEFCNRAAQLHSYGTTLWFTVFYLPVLPLAKKQIFSECGVCHKHRALPQRKWEEIRSQTIADARAAADAEPQDPIAAAQLLGALMSCFEREEAEQLAGDLVTRFPESSDALMAAGACFEKYGHAPESERAFWAALNADPTNLAAKRAVAWRIVQRHDPHSAEQLMRADPPLTAEHDPGLFVTLGHEYQAQGSSAEAMAAFTAAVAAAPQFAQDPKHRKAIAAAERAAGATTSVLPELSVWRRFRWLLPALGATSLVAIAAAANFYIAEHRTLHIVNGFGAPLVLRLEDGREIQAPARAQATVPIAEGSHVVQVACGDRGLGSEPFEISSGYWERFFRKPLYVLNPGGGAALLWEKVTYSAAPNAGAGEDRLYVGAVFFAFDDIDCPFEQFPRTVQIKRGQTLTKTRVSLLPIAPMKLLAAPEHLLSGDERLSLAEAHLRLAPNDAELRDVYKATSAKYGADERARQFLASLAPIREAFPQATK